MLPKAPTIKTMTLVAWGAITMRKSAFEIDFVALTLGTLGRAQDTGERPSVSALIMVSVRRRAELQKEMGL